MFAIMSFILHISSSVQRIPKMLTYLLKFAGEYAAFRNEKMHNIRSFFHTLQCGLVIYDPRFCPLKIDHISGLTI